MTRFYEDATLQRVQDHVFTTLRSSPPDVLPPGLSKAQFKDICDKFVSILGADNFHTGEDLLHFSDPYFVNEQIHLPSAAVCPASIAEIQEILKVANQYRVPLWTCSRGKNLGYGGPAPKVSGSVVLMLHRMDKILEVNDKMGFIVVEPGVTFFDVYKHVRDNKLKVWPSCPGVGWGSVIGNALERGFGYTTTGDHHQFICGMEVLLANGDLVRTGQWAISNSKTAHVCKNSFGPQIDGLFLQSNLGIVTKLAMWVTPQPEAIISVQINAEEREDIVQLVDILGALYRDGVLQNDPNVVNVFNYSAMHIQKADYHEGEGLFTREETKRLQRDMHGGYWKANLDFYGSKGMVLARLEELKRSFGRNLPGSWIDSQLVEGKNGGLVDAEDVQIRPLGAGVPSMAKMDSTSYTLLDQRTGFGSHSDISPILPPDGKQVFQWIEEATKISASHGFDLIVGGHVFPKHVVLIHPFLYNRSDKKDVENVMGWSRSLITKSKEMGHASYRSHLTYMDDFQSFFDFNNHAYRRFVEGLKSSLDPNGILSPGKQGIWPAKKTVT